MKVKEYRFFAADFETTVYENQTNTAVWAAAFAELFTDKVTIKGSIQDFFKAITTLEGNLCIYFHNLKFDGMFILDYLFRSGNYTQALTGFDENDVTHTRYLNETEMKSKQFKVVISDRGQWYKIIIKHGRRFIEFRDSLKLLPFSLSAIGKAFKTKHQKLEMNYKGFRYPNCEIPENDKMYIENDVYVLKEALEIMFTRGHKKLTIGSCCLSEYKKIIGEWDFKQFFPNVQEIEINENRFNACNVDEYIRRAYKGGWCYVVKGKENKIFTNGTTADVNSLYPSVMHSESGNRYPVGKPTFWKGDYLPNICECDEIYFFIRIKTRFYLKKDKLPFIQIKGNPLYRGTECLETSDVYDKHTGKYYTHYYSDGIKHDTRQILTMTQTDFKLFLEHYNVVDFEILDGCYFLTEIGIFDGYINHYAEIKKNAKGAERTLAKLFLNNLYGKFATSTQSNFKVAYFENDIVQFFPVPANDKQPGFIPVGAAVTSYARNFTIRAAQQNYHGIDKPGFIYADTDSIHCNLSPDEITGIKVHDTNFNCWKLEAGWNIGFFIRQKTYIEHVTHEDLKPIPNPYYNIKCAGMPKHCKDLFIMSVVQPWKTEPFKYLEYLEDLEQNEYDYIMQPRKITDFDIYFNVPGKLRPVTMPGGVVLKDTSFVMHPVHEKNKNVIFEAPDGYAEDFNSEF
ncbi:MAG: hypothetical protein MJ237_08325 [bacterium]|nr:hypothetical protein [bacterium]